VPHNFIKISAETPNPGRRTREEVARVIEFHKGEFVNLWFDDRKNPHHAYVLARGGNVDGMMADLSGHQVTQLWLENEL
jgi:hypothetical protein